MSKNTVLFGSAFTAALLLSTACATGGGSEQQEGSIVCDTAECSDTETNAFSITEESNGSFNLGNTTVVPLLRRDDVEKALGEETAENDFDVEDGKVVGSPEIGLP